MKIKLTSIMVDNQDKALKFYTEIFGFIKKHDIPVGEYKWLTVVSPEGPTIWSFLSSPMRIPPARLFRKRFSSRASQSPPSKSTTSRRNSNG